MPETNEIRKSPVNKITYSIGNELADKPAPSEDELELAISEILKWWKARGYDDAHVGRDWIGETRDEQGNPAGWEEPQGEKLELAKKEGGVADIELLLTDNQVFKRHRLTEKINNDSVFASVKTENTEIAEPGASWLKIQANPKEVVVHGFDESHKDQQQKAVNDIIEFAQEQWDMPIEVEGTDEFKLAVWKAAWDHNVLVTNFTPSLEIMKKYGWDIKPEEIASRAAAASVSVPMPSTEEQKPEEEKPEEVTAEGQEPEEEEPEEEEPEEEEPEAEPSEEQKPEEEKPEEVTAEEQKPEGEKPSEEQKPEEEKPEEATAEGQEPEEEEPEAEPSEEQKPEEEKPEEMTAEEQKPEEEKPSEKQKPEEEKPGEATAEEQKPEEEKPSEKQKPEEEKPAVATAEEQKPEEEQAEEKPSEEQEPEEEKPEGATAEEQKPEEEKPSEEEKPEEEKPQEEKPEEKPSEEQKPHEEEKPEGATAEEQKLDEDKIQRVLKEAVAPNVAGEPETKEDSASMPSETPERPTTAFLPAGPTQGVLAAALPSADDKGQNVAVAEPPKESEEEISAPMPADTQNGAFLPPEPPQNAFAAAGAVACSASSEDRSQPLADAAETSKEPEAPPAVPQMPEDLDAPVLPATPTVEALAAAAKVATEKAEETRPSDVQRRAKVQKEFKVETIVYFSVSEFEGERRQDQKFEAEPVTANPEIHVKASVEFRESVPEAPDAAGAGVANRESIEREFVKADRPDFKASMSANGRTGELKL
jgi:hypothetical protein